MGNWVGVCTYVQGKGVSVRMARNVACTACPGVNQKTRTSRRSLQMGDRTYQDIYSPTMFHQYLGS